MFSLSNISVLSQNGTLTFYNSGKIIIVSIKMRVKMIIFVALKACLAEMEKPQL